MNQPCASPFSLAPPRAGRRISNGGLEMREGRAAARHRASLKVEREREGEKVEEETLAAREDRA
ncbi:hypothetical protein PUN28_006435 [Cardiocondyla obscurior]|uniref:Uncharacterized protein n=1 Tax=Cardiocondyla obscurior TaxID=286306 RepID=A0AAW2GBI6_9HYME